MRCVSRSPQMSGLSALSDAPVHARLSGGPGLSSWRTWGLAELKVVVYFALGQATEVDEVEQLLFLGEGGKSAFNDG